MARELPIFPLPIVLFPGAPQPLHIFEPRYRQLLQDCLAGDRRFGIAYVAPDPAPDADPVPNTGDVGCVALIRSNQPLPDGRSNVLTVGERRFVLRGWISSTRPYRVAEIEEFDDDPTDATEVTTLGSSSNSSISATRYGRVLEIQPRSTNRRSPTVRTLERPSGSGWFDRMRATQPTSPGFGTGSASGAGSGATYAIPNRRSPARQSCSSWR